MVQSIISSVVFFGVIFVLLIKFYAKIKINRLCKQNLAKKSNPMTWPKSPFTNPI